VAALPALLPATEDPELRAGLWNALASTFHDAALDPERYLDVLAATVPTEESDGALFYRFRAARRSVVSLVSSPDPALARLHQAVRARLDTAAAGSALQLAAFQNAAATAVDVPLLRGWLAGEDLPTGLSLDLDLRWAVLERLAQLGEIDRDELQAHLEQQITAVSTVAHLRAVASLPDAAAKEFAWAHFTGDVDASNYELEAAGLGMWQVGQEHLTAPYVERYFAELPETTKVREGWMLGDAASVFFPLSALDPQTLAQARVLLASDTLDPALRRAVVDATDELERRLAIRARFGGR
jgi:aminopeptidase N